MISTLAGTNQYLIREKLSDIQRAFIKKSGSLGIYKIDCADKTYKDLIANFQTVSLFSESRLIILINPSEVDKWKDNIKDIIDQVSDIDQVVFVELSLDKRTTYFKDLKKLTNFFEFELLDDANLTKWIVKEVQERRANITYDDAKYIVELVGNNQVRIKNEIEKLVNYNLQVSKDSIYELVEPSLRATVFELIDASFLGDRKKIVEVYRKLEFGEVSVQQILSTIAWQLNTIALIKAAETSNYSELIRKTKLAPFVVQKSGKLASTLSLKEISNMTQKLVELSLDIRQYNIDQEGALINYLFSLAK
ncbi:MAG TPA: DNA polymerase III subunit delta [Candidatus Saccharimonadia bacterium]|nr:DNA polymerase III subunit delta [Candidatus Saccharimonadia bacterium]